MEFACLYVCVCVCVRVFSLHPFLCMYVLVLRFVSRSQGKSNCHFKIFCFVFLFLYYIIVNDLCGKKLKKKKKKKKWFLSWYIFNKGTVERASLKNSKRELTLVVAICSTTQCLQVSTLNETLRVISKVLRRSNPFFNVTDFFYR